MTAVVSQGNSKLGKLPNVSLVPGRDCTNCKACISTCYALKAYRAWPTVKANWGANSDLLRSDPDKYFADVRAYLERAQPTLFRIHVAGDFVSLEHVLEWILVALDFPGTRFLAFTKSFDYLPDSPAELPDNLSVVVSLFPSMALPAHLESYPIAFAGELTDYATPRATDAIDCPGNCETCGVCWSLGKKGLDVSFPFH